MRPVVFFWMFITVWVLNIGTFSMVRLNFRGMRPIRLRRAPDGGAMTYIVSGLLSRTPEAFDFLLKDWHPERSGITYLEYQNFGFDPEVAGRQLARDIKKHGYYNSTIISASLGYQVSYYGAMGTTTEIAICPCIGVEAIAPRAQKLLRLVPLGQIAVFILGWLAYIPLIKTASGQNYSLALLIDQYAACARHAPQHPTLGPGDMWIKAVDDEILDNNVLYQYFKCTGSVPYPAEGGHCDFEHHGSQYLADMRPYLPR